MSSSRLPGIALDAQLDLLHWCNTPIGNAYTNGIGQVLAEAAKQSEYDETRLLVGRMSPDGTTRLHSRVVHEDQLGSVIHRAMLTRGETYALASEIIDVLEAAAPSIPDYALHRTDLPTRSGFVYFERPALFIDDTGKPLVVRAFGWDPIQISEVENRAGWTVVDSDDLLDRDGRWGILMLLWTDPSDERDHLFAEFKDWADKVRPPHSMLSMIGGIWPEGHVAGERSHLFQFLMTFFRFCQEEWIDTRAISPDRAAVRRAERRGVPDPRIKVVRLRRRAEHQVPTDREAPRQLYLNHRGIVRGHWRNQWYPSIGEHRPKWIAEFMKGPEGAPLVVDDRVFHVIR